LRYQEDGKENSAITLIIRVIAKILGIAKTTVRERQLEGIKIAKIKGKYKVGDKLDHPNR
jgi:hypothetical protein